MHTCRLNWPIIGLSVSVIRVQVKLNCLMIMFAKQTNTFHCPLEPGLFEGIYKRLVQKKCPLSVVDRVRYIENYLKDFMKEKFRSIKICPL